MPKGLPWGLSGKEPLQKTWAQSLGREDPLRKQQYSNILAWKFHGQRSLMGYSQWGHKRGGHDPATKQQQHVQKVENRDLDRYLYVTVYMTIAHNSQKVETTQMFIDRWIYKQNVAFLYKEILALFNHIRFFVTPWTVAHQAPLPMEILQARILERVAMFSSRGSSQPRDWTQVSHIADRFFTIWATREAQEYWSG